MDVKLLREATRHEHEATEAVVPLLQPGLTRESYAAVLQRFHRIVCAWDAFAAAEAPTAFAELVKPRHRCASLEADLRHLGHTPEPSAGEPDLIAQIRALIDSPSSEERSAQEKDSRFLGAMYVVEGSTLGGRYIASHVEAALDLVPGQGDRFFRGYEEQTIPMWREFQQALLSVSEEQSALVIEAAKGMFAIFQQCLDGTP